jgi:hypothetical protein
MMKAAFRLLAALLIFTPIAQTQTTAPSPAMQSARALYDSGKWADAAKAFEGVTRAEPGNGRAWFFLGSSFHSMGKYAEAVNAFQSAVRINNNPQAMYGLAASLARLGEKEKAFEWLDKAISGGLAPGRLKQLESDADLASLRLEARFKDSVEAARRAASPCMYMAEARQLDFWVGEWDVQLTATGQHVGINRIERAEDGCMIVENWAGAAGGPTGKSINFYNPNTRRWRQTYVGSNLGIWEMSGVYKDGALHYEGEKFTPGKVLVRVTFINLSPDRLRHTEDNSTDGGKTWNTVWDAMYIRKK